MDNFFLNWLKTDGIEDVNDFKSLLIYDESTGLVLKLVLSQDQYLSPGLYIFDEKNNLTVLSQFLYAYRHSSSDLQVAENITDLILFNPF